MAIGKNKILGAVLELPAKEKGKYSQITMKMSKMGSVGGAV